MQSLFAPPPHPTMESLEGRGRAALLSLGINATLIVGSLIHGLGLHYAVRRAERGDPVSMEAAMLLDRAEVGIGVGVLLSLVVTAVLYLRWVHRAHTNLVSAGLLGMEYAPGTVIRGYFIPFVNLIRPYKAMREAWRGSIAVAAGRPYAGDWAAADAHWLVGLWWVSLITSGAIGRAAVRLLPDEPTIAQLRQYASLSITGDTLTLVAAACIMALIVRITAAQRAARQALDAAPASVS